MKSFNEDDLNRSWGSEELEVLSEKDLMKLAFSRHLKNLLFFAPLYFVFNIILQFGILGKIFGSIGVLLYLVIALEIIVAFFPCLISFFGSIFFDIKNELNNIFYKFSQCLMLFLFLAIYFAFIYHLVIKIIG